MAWQCDCRRQAAYYCAWRCAVRLDVPLIGRGGRILEAPASRTDISAAWQKERRYEEDSPGNDVQRSRTKPPHHAADMGARQRGHRDRNERTAVLEFCAASTGRGEALRSEERR